MNNSNNNSFRPWVHWQPPELQVHARYEDFIPMDPSLPHHFPLHANLNNSDALNLQWPPSALTSFGGASNSPLRILILDNITRAVNPRLRRTIPQSPQRFVGQSPMAVPTTTQSESILTQEEQKDALKKLKKEIYNPTPKRIIQRLNLYYRDNDKNYSRNEKGKDHIVNEEDHEDDKRCAICLEDFEPKEVVMLTPCNHMFHEDCIVPWVKSHGNCPVCRFAICQRLSRENILPSSNNDAANMTANDPFTGVLISYIRAMDEARGASTRVPNPGPLWF